ncbi:MAG: hypothetical protein L0332_22055 [Chloroflexi bacterium]|nr:hypothetical protein [Chloroflexota bacterium]MCI0576481.1 hypothetical protein [Chloroflexota bacterium]MCI0649543.1 hypothetical protein [Chloroflexota bacterium]MCI0729381.1 hypothetical protein [Chloroflexota bacterium]
MTHKWPGGPRSRGLALGSRQRENRLKMRRPPSPTGSVQTAVTPMSSSGS